MTRVHCRCLLNGEHLWLSVPSAGWVRNAKEEAALHWSCCWDSIAIIDHRHH